MAENSPDAQPRKEEVPGPIDPATAVREFHEAMVILPKRRFGCLGRVAKYGAVAFVLLAAFVYWNFVRRPPLKISKETTYITAPLTRDGARVDFFAASEQLLYPPQMKTDDNGYRLIVRALGDVPRDRGGMSLSGQVYEKLGLDRAIKPTMTFVETHEFLQLYCRTKGLSQKQGEELDQKVYSPWTLADLPMLEPWLQKHGPVLDLVAQAVRKPAFSFPLVRPHADATLAEAIPLGEATRFRAFARMLGARANYRIGTGDIDGAINDIVTCARLGRHLEGQGTVIFSLVGIAIRGIAGAHGIAAVRTTQPTKEQLQRLVDESNAIPPRPEMSRWLVAERYYTLDSLQAMALAKGPLASLFSTMPEEIQRFKPKVAMFISVDWNIVMRRVNAQLDDWEHLHVARMPTLLSPGNLFLGTRSQRVADLMIALHIPALQAMREANHRSICQDHLRSIALAMLLYERDHGALPPAYTVDATGKPLHSWRVLLLPYLGEQELFGKLRLDEPWDGEHNRRFHDTAVAVYQCPSAELKPGQTTYSVVVGEKTAFQASKGKPLDDFGMHLMLVVERRRPVEPDARRQAVCWMDPASDLTEAAAFAGINRREKDADGIGSPHPGGAQAGMRDGSSQFISETIAQTTLRGLLDGTAKERTY